MFHCIYLLENERSQIGNRTLGKLRNRSGPRSTFRYWFNSHILFIHGNTASKVDKLIQIGTGCKYLPQNDQNWYGTLKICHFQYDVYETII